MQECRVPDVQFSLIHAFLAVATNQQTLLLLLMTWPASILHKGEACELPPNTLGVGARKPFISPLCQASKRRYSAKMRRASPCQYPYQWISPRKVATVTQRTYHHDEDVPCYLSTLAVSRRAIATEKATAPLPLFGLLVEYLSTHCEALAASASSSLTVAGLAASLNVVIARVSAPMERAREGDVGRAGRRCADKQRFSIGYSQPRSGKPLDNVQLEGIFTSRLHIHVF